MTIDEISGTKNITRTQENNLSKNVSLRKHLANNFQCFFQLSEKIETSCSNFKKVF